jgi:hypothetical protein
MAEIVNPISQRNFELVRDRIANILAIELTSQATLTGNSDLNATIQTERFVPVKDTELPLVNVMLARGDYNMFTTITQDGTYIYHIDVYTQANYTGNDRADELAFQKLQRLVGVCQAILSDSKYITLGWQRPSVERVQVNGITFAEPSNNKDSTTSVMGRLEFQVRIPESVEVKSLNLIDGYDTSVLIGNTDEGYVFSGNNAPIPPASCDPVTVTINTNELTESIESGGIQNFNLLNQEGEKLEITNRSDDDVTLNTWWNRNPDWLDIPEIATDEFRFVGLYAVYEYGFKTVKLTAQESFTVDWGDGTIESGLNSYEYTYDYSAVNSDILVDENGYNYKMVLVDVEFDGRMGKFNISAPTSNLSNFNSNLTQNWLDVRLNIVPVFIDSPRLYVTSFQNLEAKKLERIWITGVMTGNAASAWRFSKALRVLEYEAGVYDGNLILQETGDIRDNSGNVLNNIEVTSQMFNGSLISEIGNVTVEGFGAFVNSRIQVVGDVTLSKNSNMQDVFSNCSYLRRVGIIYIDTNVTIIFRIFSNCSSLPKVIFSGDMSGVTGSFQAFLNCYSLKELILPNMRVGFDISDTQISGQYLQDLGDSLGTANGAQTITLPLFVNGQDVSVFTNKGYTVAYS